MRRTSSRSAFTWIELVAVIVVLGVVIALLLPAIESGREAARRISCLHHLKQIGFALHNYATVNKVFPPGTICATDSIQPSNQYDVWGEAAQTGSGFQGTGFLLPIMPFFYNDNKIASRWDHSVGISCTTGRGGYSNFALASTDPKDSALASIEELYCPTRRNALRSDDSAMMLSSAWTGGGTDYGGCAGRHAAFTLKTGYNLCDATMYYEPSFYPTPFKGKKDDKPEKRWGIFGRVNVSTKFKEITDGLSNTIMTGELQRITDLTPGSKDGWAIGGPATLFTTGAMMAFDGRTVSCAASPSKGRLSNNHFWGSPGSDHPGGANYGMADNCVRFLSESMDPAVFALLGSMADGEKIEPP